MSDNSLFSWLHGVARKQDCGREAHPSERLPYTPRPLPQPPAREMRVLAIAGNQILRFKIASVPRASQLKSQSHVRVSY